MVKTRKAEDRVRCLAVMRGLAPGLVRRIQVGAVQAEALYRAKIWWNSQKGWYQEYQTLINRQNKAVTEIF